MARNRANIHGAQKHKDSNLEIDIFGNGNQTEQLRSLVVELNLGSVVKFHESKNLSFLKQIEKTGTWVFHHLDCTD